MVPALNVHPRQRGGQLLIIYLRSGNLFYVLIPPVKDLSHNTIVNACYYKAVIEESSLLFIN